MCLQPQNEAKKDTDWREKEKQDKGGVKDMTQNLSMYREDHEA